MRNVSFKHDGKMLVISIDTSKSLGPSKTGKSILVGSTGGNVEVAPGLKIGVNAYRTVSTYPDGTGLVGPEKK